MSEEKTVPVNVRVARDAIARLNSHCDADGSSQADAIREAIDDWNIKKERTQKGWSPVQEYKTYQNEPGQGYDESKGRWNPELITSYNQKVIARQRKAQED